MPLLTKQPIVVPWDFSEMSKDALATAVDLADSNSQIHVVNVMPLPASMEPAVWQPLDETNLRENLTKSFHKAVPPEKYPGITFDVLFGDPGSQIARLAKDLKAGLVVISSHGRSGIAHFFMGSVAERVTRLSPCPVLVLRGEKN